MNLAPPPHGRSRHTPGRRRFSTSGWLTPALVALICVALLVAAWERGHGHLHNIAAVVSPQNTVPQPFTFRPGGQDPILLSRTATEIGRDPEFLSATLLPGRGMNVYQITALIPGHGEVSLLYSPPLADATSIFSGEGDDDAGQRSTTVGGALLLPWARRLSGTATSTPPNAPSLLHTTWNGLPLTFPASAPGSTLSTDGLLLNLGATAVTTAVQPDGQSAQATFHAGSFSGALPSTVDVTVSVELSAHTLDLTVSASNTGKEPVPFGIGWKPLFAIPSGDRANAQLVIPSTTVVETSSRTGLPSGRTLQIDGTPLDFSHIRGTKLGAALDQTYTSLQSTLLADGPTAEIHDTVDNITLRVIPTTPNINSMHVVAPANKPWISIGPNTNLDDPLGPEWADPRNSGIVTLAPGASMVWKVRLEIASLAPAEAPL
jgi:aldose 1-epimerase